MPWLLHRFRRLVLAERLDLIQYIPSSGCVVFRQGSFRFVVYRKIAQASNEIEGKSAGEIFFYYTAPHLRGKSLAKRLISLLIRKEKSLKLWFCEVAITNQPSLCTLLKLGFKRTALRKAYYDFRIPAVLLTRG